MLHVIAWSAVTLHTGSLKRATAGLAPNVQRSALSATIYGSDKNNDRTALLELFNLQLHSSLSDFARKQIGLVTKIKVVEFALASWRQVMQRRNGTRCRPNSIVGVKSPPTTFDWRL